MSESAQDIEDLIGAMASLEGNPDYEKMMQCLANELRRMKDALVLCNDDLQLKWLQGQAQAYQGLINQAASARDDLERVRKAKKTAAAQRHRNQGTAPGALN
jgi:hypothetical protein